MSQTVCFTVTITMKVADALPPFPMPCIHWNSEGTTALPTSPLPQETNTPLAHSQGTIFSQGWAHPKQPSAQKSTPISHLDLLIHHANPTSAASTVLHDITHVLHRTRRFIQPPGNKYNTPCLASFPIFLLVVVHHDSKGESLHCAGTARYC